MYIAYLVIGSGQDCACPRPHRALIKCEQPYYLLNTLFFLMVRMF